MEEKTIQLILATSTCISGLILLYFAVTHLRYLKDSISRIIDSIKNLIAAKEKEQQVKEETYEALKKIDDTVKEKIRAIDDSFDERYKKFSDQIDNYKYKKPEPVTPPQPTPPQQPLQVAAETPPMEQITIDQLPKPLIYAGPVLIALGLLYYFLTKDRKK